MNGGKGNTLERGRQPAKPMTVPVKNPNQGGNQQKQQTTSGGKTGSKKS
jgi:hypothetical protein